MSTSLLLLLLAITNARRRGIFVFKLSDACCGDPAFTVMSYQASGTPNRWK